MKEKLTEERIIDLQFSYECVADCGRFVEIAKYELQMNKQLGMISFSRDISFVGLSADRKLFMDRDFMKNGFTITVITE